jgi:hypothetical protein
VKVRRKDGLIRIWLKVLASTRRSQRASSCLSKYAHYNKFLFSILFSVLSFSRIFSTRPCRNISLVLYHPLSEMLNRMYVPESPPERRHCARCRAVCKTCGGTEEIPNDHAALSLEIVAQSKRQQSTLGLKLVNACTEGRASNQKTS